MAAKLKVTYLDGKEVEVVATPRAQVETERFLRNQGGFSEASVVEAGYRLAYQSLIARRLIDPGLGHDEWLDSIADVEQLEETAPDPTPEAQSPTSSSD